MKVSELSGPLLDYWVARAEGRRYVQIWKSEMCPIKDTPDLCVDCQDNIPVSFRPSTNWADGGPIIERERMLLVPKPDGGWTATTTNSDCGTGETALVAAMRCMVASKFGEEVPGEGEQG